MALTLYNKNGKPITPNMASQRGQRGRPRTATLVTTNANFNMPRGLRQPILPEHVANMLNTQFVLVPAGFNTTLLSPRRSPKSRSPKSRSPQRQKLPQSFSNLQFTKRNNNRPKSLTELEQMAYQSVGGRISNRHQNKFENLLLLNQLKL